MQLSRKGLSCAFIAAITWSLVGVFVRMLHGCSPMFIVCGRFIMALCAIFPAVLLSSPNRAALLRDGAKLATWWLSVMMLGYYVLTVSAFQQAPLVEVTLCINTSPLFSLAFKWITGSKIDRYEAVGSYLAIAGVGVLLLPALMSASVSIGYWIGGALAIFSAAINAAYAIYYRHLQSAAKSPEPISVTTVTFLMGSILVPFLFQSDMYQRVIDVKVLLILILLGILSTAIPTICYSIAARTLSPVLTTTVLLSTPFLAGLFASAILHERASPLVIPAGLLISAGILLTTIGQAGNRKSCGDSAGKSSSIFRANPK